jgi:hypothetical protein
MHGELDIYTTKQKRFIAALAKHKNFHDVSKELGISMRQVYRYAANIKGRIRNREARKV